MSIDNRHTVQGITNAILLVLPCLVMCLVFCPKWHKIRILNKEVSTKQILIYLNTCKQTWAFCHIVMIFGEVIFSDNVKFKFITIFFNVTKLKFFS